MPSTILPSAFTRQPQCLAPVDPYWRAKMFPVTGKSAASVVVPGGREMVFQDTNAVPALFGITPTRTITASGITTSWAGDNHYEIPLQGLTSDFSMLVVIGSFQSGTAASICSARNNNSAAYSAQVVINSSGFYEVYEDATLKATGGIAAVPGDVLVIVRSGGGTLTTVYTPREIISSGAVASVTMNVFRIGRTGRVATGTKGIALFVGFTSTLDAAAARSLVANPWQVFQSMTRKFLFGAAAAAAGGFFSRYYYDMRGHNV